MTSTNNFHQPFTDETEFESYAFDVLILVSVSDLMEGGGYALDIISEKVVDASNYGLNDYSYEAVGTLEGDIIFRIEGIIEEIN